MSTSLTKLGIQFVFFATLRAFLNFWFFRFWKIYEKKNEIYFKFLYWLNNKPEAGLGIGKGVGLVKSKLHSSQNFDEVEFK